MIAMKMCLALRNSCISGLARLALALDTVSFGGGGGGTKQLTFHTRGYARACSYNA